MPNCGKDEPRENYPGRKGCNSTDSVTAINFCRTKFCEKISRDFDLSKNGRISVSMVSALLYLVVANCVTESFVSCILMQYPMFS